MRLQMTTVPRGTKALNAPDGVHAEKAGIDSAGTVSSRHVASEAEVESRRSSKDHACAHSSSEQLSVFNTSKKKDAMSQPTEERWGGKVWGSALTAVIWTQ
jgi:hypothetical protein